MIAIVMLCAGGGVRSQPAFDRQFGWLYLICQHKLIRIAVGKAFKLGYGSTTKVFANGDMGGNFVYVDRYGRMRVFDGSKLDTSVRLTCLPTAELHQLIRF